MNLIQNDIRIIVLGKNLAKSLKWNTFTALDTDLCSEQHWMKWCELREYKWNEYVTIAVNRNLSNREIALSRVDELHKLASLQCLGLHSSTGRALQRERRGHGFELLKLPFTAMVTYSFPHFSSEQRYPGLNWGLVHEQANNKKNLTK